VKEIAEARGITNPHALQTATGINYSICHRIWNGETKCLFLDTIAKLCAGLGVRPGDLFEYKP
jgi:DNA-binding Xre family transcriptional regulator